MLLILLLLDDNVVIYMLDELYVYTFQNHEQAIRDCAISYECVGFGCGDLHIIEGTSTRKDYDRDIIDISTFVVDDYEVFQVKKKI
ncbi:5184_t:CDS:2 [Rhizophagus irregularis]|nr:5184_t:CDS:2 [Rhizophagus irregularis]